MQTFLPSTSFTQSAQWLDFRRLGKQRPECYQILQALTNSNYGWRNHPAVRMWRGYEQALVDYGICICNEWIARGYKDSCTQKILDMWRKIGIDMTPSKMPPWLTEEFASSHRAILLGKDWQWYQQWNWPEKPAVRNEAEKWPYLWPVEMKQ